MYLSLCYAATEAPVYDLENYVVALVAGKEASYTLDQVEDPINKVVGSGAGSLIMDDLIKKYRV